MNARNPFVVKMAAREKTLSAKLHRIEQRLDWLDTLRKADIMAQIHDPDPQ